MKFSSIVGQLCLSLCLAAPALAAFKLNVPQDLMATTPNFFDLVEEVKLIERDVNVMLEHFVRVFTEYNTNPLYQETLYDNFGRDIGARDVQELKVMTQNVQGSTLTVKQLNISSATNNPASVDSVGQPSSNGQLRLGAKLTKGPVYSINRADKTISFYSSFFDPNRAPPRRAGLVVAAAFKVICNAQDTFMKNSLGRWQPVRRSQTIGKNATDVIDTLTDDGFIRLGSEAYWATIHDSEAFKWLGLEYHGISRYPADGSQNLPACR